MQHYEFSTTIEKGAIFIPEDILNKLTSKVKVIICANNNIEKVTKQNFSALNLQTKEFKFNREETNER
jgi:hypothetical protein